MIFIASCLHLFTWLIIFLNIDHSLIGRFINLFKCLRITFKEWMGRLISVHSIYFVFINQPVDSVFLCIYALSLEVQMSDRECWDPVNCFISGTLFYMSQVRTCICRGLFCFQWLKVIGDGSFFEIGECFTKTFFN